MKKALLFSLLLTIKLQAQQVEWAKSTGSIFNDNSYGLYADPAGNIVQVISEYGGIQNGVLVTGSNFGINFNYAGDSLMKRDFPQGVFKVFNTGEIGLWNYFNTVYLLNNSLIVTDSIVFSYASNVNYVDFAKTGDGKYIMSGTYSTMGPPSLPGQPTKQHYYAYISEHDSTGNRLSSRTSSIRGYGRKLLSTSVGSVYTNGYFDTSHQWFKIDDGSTLDTISGTYSNGFPNYYLYANIGTEIWQNFFIRDSAIINGAMINPGSSLTQSHLLHYSMNNTIANYLIFHSPNVSYTIANVSAVNGLVYVSGSFTDQLSVDGITLTNPGQNLYILCLSQNDQVLWYQTIPLNGTATVKQVAIDLFGNTYLSGNFSGTIYTSPALISNFDVDTTTRNNTDCFLIKLNMANVLAVSTVEEKNNVIFPNPFNDRINITSASMQTMSCFDVKGRFIFTKKIQGNEAFDTSLLKSGIYFFELRDEKGKTKTYKMIKR